MKNFFYAILVIAGLSVASSASALTISPATLEIQGDPGKTVTAKIQLLNEEKEEKIFYSSFENFEPTGETGVPHFIGDEDGLATWIKVNSQIDLMPGERREVSFTVDIPEGTEPGGYFSAIFWGTQPPAAKGSDQVSIGGKLGILVMLRVTGDAEEGGGLLEFRETNNDRFFTKLPINFVYRFNNSGANRIVPLGDIKIKNLLGLTTAKFSANKNDGSILPGSIRKFEAPWIYANSADSKVNTNEELSFFEIVEKQWREFHFGWYKANMSLMYGTANQAAEASYWFFIFPWQVLLVIILIIVFIGFFGRLGLKKYNSWVIAQAKQQNK